MVDKIEALIAVYGSTTIKNRVMRPYYLLWNWNIINYISNGFPFGRRMGSDTY